MPIPKGLIIYTAKRHQEVYPMNIKYRHYSNKIFLPPGAPKPIRETTIHHKNQTKIIKVAKITKFVQNLDLTLHLLDPKTNQVMRYFSKLNRIKTCDIEVNRFHRGSDSEGFVIKLLKRGFRTMKDLQEVSLKRLEPLRYSYGTFKNLLLQRSLQRLTVTHLYSTQNVNDLSPFTKFCQVANRRKCWPHLNYFSIDMTSFEFWGADRNFVRGPDSNLLKFLQDFKSFDSLYKCAHFQLDISNEACSNLSSEEYAAADKMLKMKLPLTQISVCQGEHITSLFQAAQDLKDLRSLDLMPSSGRADILEIDSLKKISNLQDLRLGVGLDVSDGKANFSYFALEKLQSMTNLRSLSLDFYGDLSSVGDLVCKALSKLTELTYLSVYFPGDYYDDEDEKMKFSWPWLKQVFEEIGRMKKLKTLHLGFEAFNLEGSSSIFKSLCQALGNLTQLSSFHLEIGDAESIQDKDILTLASSLTRLTMMKSLTLSFGWDSKFKSSTFVVLMDSIVKNLKILSEFILKIDGVDVTKQCCQVIKEGIHKMKYLNKMRLEIGGIAEEGVDLAILDAEVRKKMAGYVSGALEG